MVLTYFPRLLSLDQQRVEAWERPDSDTLWAKVTSPENWREVQRKVRATDTHKTSHARAGTDTHKRYITPAHAPQPTAEGCD